jgi:hypothetical protein
MCSAAHRDFPVLGIADVVPPSQLARNAGADAVPGPSPSDVEEAENDVTALGIRYLTETEIARCVCMHAAPLAGNVTMVRRCWGVLVYRVFTPPVFCFVALL